MIIQPYQSPYYEKTPFYERYGNFYLQPNSEVYLYITDLAINGIEYCRYSISNKMHIYDYKRNVFVNIRENEYLSADFYIPSKRKYVTFNIHRVYMMTFCYFAGCENYEVNHIDGNKHNANPSNLEWMTHRDNMNHANTYLLDSKISDDEIVEIINMYNNGCTVKSISTKFNISTAYVSYIVRGTDDDYGDRIKNIKLTHPVTREKFAPKISNEELAIIAKEYNDGADYFYLADKYGIDRSALTKRIKKYAASNPEIKLRKLKLFDEIDVNNICKIIDMYYQSNPSNIIISKCIELLNFENNSSVRKCISNILNLKTYRNISSKYNFGKGSTTIERVVE